MGDVRVAARLLQRGLSHSSERAPLEEVLQHCLTSWNVFSLQSAKCVRSWPARGEEVCAVSETRQRPVQVHPITVSTHELIHFVVQKLARVSPVSRQP